MGVLDSFVNKLADFKERFSKQVYGSASSLDASELEDAKRPSSPLWLQNPIYGYARLGVNISELRIYARSVWIQMVVNTIKKEVTSTPWKFVPVDEDDNPEDLEKNYVAPAMELFENANINRESFFDLMNPVVGDVAEIDAGAIVKVFTANSYEVDENNENRVVLKPFGQRKLKELWYADGGTLLYDVTFRRVIKGYFQYSFRNPVAAPLYYSKDEVSYYRLNTRSYDLYGFSPLQSSVQIVELMMNSDRFNKDFFQNNAVPDAIMTIEDVRNQDDLESIRNEWNRHIKGKAHKLMFLSSKGKLQPLSMNNKDMEWLDGQKWYKNAIFGVYGVSSVEAGFHQDVNHNAQAGQERITVKNAIEPYYRLIEERVNKDILPELFQEERPPIKFKFFPKDQAKESVEFQQAMSELQAGALTINEFRNRTGRDEVPWGDVPFQGFGFSGGVVPGQERVDSPSEVETEKAFDKGFEGFVKEKKHGSKQS